MRAYLDVLALRRYRLLWIGDTLSSLGDSVGFLALIWLVYVTAGSAATLGGFVATYTAPVIVGGPLVGAALDRFDRRRLMLADNVVRGVLVALVPVLHLLGVLAVWQLYVFAFVYGLLKMVPLAGVPALIPELVPEERLEAAPSVERTRSGWMRRATPRSRLHCGGSDPWRRRPSRARTPRRSRSAMHCASSRGHR